jgi:hypothetical protein
MFSGGVINHGSIAQGDFVGWLDGDIITTQRGGDRIYPVAKDAFVDGRTGLSQLHHIRRTRERGKQNVETKCIRTVTGNGLIVKASRPIKYGEELLAQSNPSARKHRTDGEVMRRRYVKLLIFKTLVLTPIISSQGELSNSSDYEYLSSDDMTDIMEVQISPKTYRQWHKILSELATRSPKLVIDMENEYFNRHGTLLTKTELDYIMKAYPCCRMMSRTLPKTIQHIDEQCLKTC